MIADRVFALKKYLTPIRRRYPWFIGAALWIGWLISITAGYISGRTTDRFGQLIGTDFAAFYTAGEILLTGQSPRLYDPGLAIQIQTKLYGFEPQNFNPYLNPPFYAWLFVPFALVPYPASPILWMALNLFLLLLAMRALSVLKPWPVFLLALTWLPAWSAISFGQNTFLSLFIFALSYNSWRKQRFFLAGLLIGLMLYKPQLMIGVIVIWILDWKRSWMALVGMMTTGLLLLGASYIFMPEATQAYFSYVQRISSSLMTHPAFPIWNAHGTYTFWHGIFPGSPQFSTVFYLATAAFGLAIFLRFYFSAKHTPPVIYSAAMILTVWTTPYLMIYDWAILLIAAILLWQEVDQEHQSELWVVFSIIWVAMLVSGPLTAVQWRWLGQAIQISIPAFAFAVFLMHSLVTKKIRTESSNLEIINPS